MSDCINEIIALLRQAKAGDKDVQIGEEQCAFCGADLGEKYPTLRIHTPDLTAYIRLCPPCARRFDVEEGIFGLVHGRHGEANRKENI